MMKKVPLYLLIIIQLSCTNNELLFEEVGSSSTNVEFTNLLTESDNFNILDYLYFYNGGGLAIGDINGDDLPDIYISGNQVKNKLYLNKGNMTFEDITSSAGVAGTSDWNTGAVMGDVNGDGLLDIYVCAVVGIRGLNGFNELFINNGDNTFTEQAQEYGLDFDSYSSTAAFLDYDKDGDLDMLILNHAIHTQESFGHANLRMKRTYETGDKLMRNDGDVFVDVSEEAGIYGGVNGYGLGISIADFNQDGYPDIYIGNDFHEDDYYYLNNGDGTFSESLKDFFMQTTRFSMGNDVADINHDGLPDLISLDMLPEDETILKKSEGDEDINIMKLRTSQYGYYYQFSRNMLQVNTGNGFKEVALMNGVAATDWSWSALFADYNQDGEQDLFISNGIPKRPNDLDYIKFVSNDQVKDKIDATKLVDQKALDLMPSGAVANYVFQGTGEGFENKSGTWIENEKSFSTATAMGDLDNDGDLDLVINNINAPLQIFENKTNASASYLKVKVQFSPSNSYGIGTKIYAYTQGVLQYREVYGVRGFQSSSEPIAHFGFDTNQLVDSIRFVWPDLTTELMTDVKVNQMLTITPNQTTPLKARGEDVNKKLMFQPVVGNLGIDFTHVEDRYTDFDRQKLIPYQVSDRGPAVTIGDLNHDGKDDIFFGGAKFTSSQIYQRGNSSFENVSIPSIQNDSTKEEVVATIADFTGNGKNDLVIGAGGADFYNKMKPLLNSYYQADSSDFLRSEFPESFENASTISANDYDQDGDLDLFIGNLCVSNDFGRTPISYLLNNAKGSFTVVENLDLSNMGMVTDAVWSDYDKDGDDDLLVVGEWMSPKLFVNTEGRLTESKSFAAGLNGLWQAISPFDIDGDGDIDYVLGNWGLNSKFTASSKFPMKMYYGDFDQNGATETVVATEKKGKYYPFENLDGLASQMVSMRKKYTSYKDFAGKEVEDVIENILSAEQVLEVNELSSGYLVNENGTFEFKAFRGDFQVAPITTFLPFDFDGDGNEELLVAGNYFGMKPYHGRLGSFGGAIVFNDREYAMGNEIGLDFMNKSVRALDTLNFDGKMYVLVTINNDKAQVYEISSSK